MSHGIPLLLFVLAFLALVWAAIMLATVALIYAEGERNRNV